MSGEQSNVGTCVSKARIGARFLREEIGLALMVCGSEMMKIALRAIVGRIGKAVYQSVFLVELREAKRKHK